MQNGYQKRLEIKVNHTEASAFKSLTIQGRAFSHVKGISHSCLNIDICTQGAGF